MATFTVFPTQSRSAGSYESATASYSGAGLSCNFAIVSSSWATDNPAIVVKVQVQYSWDAGASWEDVMAFTTIPGSFDKNGHLPAGGFISGDNRGDRLVRAVLTLTGTLTLGLTVTIV